MDAGMQAHGISLQVRYGACIIWFFSPLLPPLILYRLYKRVNSRGSQQHMSEFMRSLPYIMIFTLAWAFV